jgi:valyl-tRNA synthetase
MYGEKNTLTNTIEILVLKEKMALKFEEGVNIASQKNRILEKIAIIDVKIKNLNNKLKNKAYLQKAPKNIVQNDKVLLNDLIIEENKLRSIVSSIN